MEAKVTLDAIYAPSEEVVSRDIEGELIIVPLASGVGGAEDETDAIFTLNETGRAIWDRLAQGSQRSLRDVVVELAAEFEAAESEIEADVLGLVGELVKRNMLVEVSGV
ncbi:MAG: PqqD family peptide modification chaperone [Chloroflexi bacterium]|nr:PqqD family peptide modification chaperone [Chloroflexota bacterium]MBU1746191.1 PqqD family peptide modification chaperone [Chloroflexota bacterium]MBU1877717.1 PqqD family peptide modification chaperone [Chloroflexota bacterium]